MLNFNIKRFDLNLLVVFLELWETRSVTRTSEKLSITQSAVSHALKRLRAALDDELFLQSRAGLRPTPRAQRLVEPIKKALEEIGDTLSLESSFDPKSVQREFDIAMGEIVELLTAPLLVKKIAEEAPGVSLKLRAMPDTRTACAMLEKGELQLVLSTRDISGAAIQNEVLTQLPLVAMLSRNAISRGITMGLDSYLSIPHVIINPVDHRGSIIDLVLAKKGLKRPIGAVVQNYMVMVMVAAQCGYICNLPHLLADQFGDLLGLDIYELPIEVPPSQLIATSHIRFQSDPGVAWLLQKVRETLKDSPLSQ
ncbi:PCP degradation transcriptional activation protein [Paraburkholderia domus]|uniref:LysR family transcriptional regulator n=1 Tax=Paraburkholderia domus TaxID=2793075 RepID=UPI00191261E3|nr:LysR family transcriptional regulator [Paraburkholderia domus]MBK5050458.1 LysR family transcriptional regulator [Burkholderia sp. R-70006]CAE6754628.1 PCP degradation transcriptional activation protein [Paraburkholderia domus]